MFIELFNSTKKRFEQDEQCRIGGILINYYLCLPVILRKCCNVVCSLRCHKGQTCCRWVKTDGKCTDCAEITDVLWMSGDLTVNYGKLMYKQ